MPTMNGREPSNNEMDRLRWTNKWTALNNLFLQGVHPKFEVILSTQVTEASVSEFT